MTQFKLNRLVSPNKLSPMTANLTIEKMIVNLQCCQKCFMHKQYNHEEWMYHQNYCKLAEIVQKTCKMKLIKNSNLTNKNILSFEYIDMEGLENLIQQNKQKIKPEIGCFLISYRNMTVFSLYQSRDFPDFNLIGKIILSLKKIDCLFSLINQLRNSQYQSLYQYVRFKSNYINQKTIKIKSVEQILAQTQYKRQKILTSKQNKKTQQKLSSQKNIFLIQKQKKQFSTKQHKISQIIKVNIHEDKQNTSTLSKNDNDSLKSIQQKSINRYPTLSKNKRQSSCSRYRDSNVSKSRNSKQQQKINKRRRRYKNFSTRYSTMNKKTQILNKLVKNQYQKIKQENYQYLTKDSDVRISYECQKINYKKHQHFDLQQLSDSSNEDNDESFRMKYQQQIKLYKKSSFGIQHLRDSYNKKGTNNMLVSSTNLNEKSMNIISEERQSYLVEQQGQYSSRKMKKDTKKVNNRILQDQQKMTHIKLKNRFIIQKSIPISSNNNPKYDQKASQQMNQISQVQKCDKNSIMLNSIQILSQANEQKQSNNYQSPTQTKFSQSQKTSPIKNKQFSQTKQVKLKQYQVQQKDQKSNIILKQSKIQVPCDIQQETIQNKYNNKQPQQTLQTQREKTDIERQDNKVENQIVGYQIGISNQQVIQRTVQLYNKQPCIQSILPNKLQKIDEQNQSQINVSNVVDIENKALFNKNHCDKVQNIKQTEVNNTQSKIIIEPMQINHFKDQTTDRDQNTKINNPIQKSLLLQKNEPNQNTLTKSSNQTFVQQTLFNQPLANHSLSNKSNKNDQFQQNKKIEKNCQNSTIQNNNKQQNQIIEKVPQNQWKRIYNIFNQYLHNFEQNINSKIQLHSKSINKKQRTNKNQVKNKQITRKSQYQTSKSLQQFLTTVYPCPKIILNSKNKKKISKILTSLIQNETQSQQCPNQLNKPQQLIQNPIKQQQYQQKTPHSITITCSTNICKIFLITHQNQPIAINHIILNTQNLLKSKLFVSKQNHDVQSFIEVGQINKQYKEILFLFYSQSFGLYRKSFGDMEMEIEGKVQNNVKKVCPLVKSIEVSIQVGNDSKLKGHQGNMNNLFIVFDKRAKKQTIVDYIDQNDNKHKQFQGQNSISIEVYEQDASEHSLIGSIQKKGNFFFQLNLQQGKYLFRITNNSHYFRSQKELIDLVFYSKAQIQLVNQKYVFY